MSIPACNDPASFLLHRYREMLMQHPQLRANSPKPSRPTNSTSASSSSLSSTIARATASASARASTPPPRPDPATPPPLRGKIVSVAWSDGPFPTTIVLSLPKQSGWMPLQRAVRTAFDNVHAPLPDQFRVGYYDPEDARLITGSEVVRNNDALVVLPVPSPIVHNANMLGVPDQLQDLTRQVVSNPLLRHVLTNFSKGTVTAEDKKSAKVIMQCVRIYDTNKARNERSACR